MGIEPPSPAPPAEPARPHAPAYNKTPALSEKDELSERERQHLDLYRTLDAEGRAVVDSVTTTYAEKARDEETSSGLTGIDKRA